MPLAGRNPQNIQLSNKLHHPLTGRITPGRWFVPDGL